MNLLRIRLRDDYGVRTEHAGQWVEILNELGEVLGGLVVLDANYTMRVGQLGVLNLSVKVDRAQVVTRVLP